MAHAAQHRGILSTVNEEVREHPLENGFAAATAILGLVALVTALFPGLHLISSWAGLLGIVCGGRGQMISATTAERFVMVVGLGAAAVGFYLGMAHGGLFGGLIG